MFVKRNKVSRERKDAILLQLQRITLIYTIKLSNRLYIMQNKRYNIKMITYNWHYLERIFLPFFPVNLFLDQNVSEPLSRTPEVLWNKMQY